MARSKGLGRGLSALIGEGGMAVPGDAGGVVSELAVHAIRASEFQPRKEFSGQELEELADSIRHYGVVQPITVRAVDGGYEVIAGERRLRAAKMAGLETIPAWVRETSDREMVALALIENIQREDLNPLEEAEAYRRLSEELGWTQEEIAEQVGRARSHVANYVRLLQLQDKIQEWVRNKTLTMAHAKVLLGIEDEKARMRLAQACVLENWTVRELEQRRMRPSLQRKPASKELDVHMRQVEEGLRRALGAGVKVHGDGKKGRIEIRYRSLEELERLLEVLANAETVPESFPV